MTKRVLSIGQCGPDHHAIATALSRWFDVTVDQAERWHDAEAALTSRHYDLLLVNRHLDIDYSLGLAIVQQVKDDARWQQLPIMLVSNYPESQAEAVAAGAVLGFGKAELSDEATRLRLATYLA